MSSLRGVPSMLRGVPTDDDPTPPASCAAIDSKWTSIECWFRAIVGGGEPGEDELFVELAVEVRASPLGTLRVRSSGMPSGTSTCGVVTAQCSA